MLLLFGGTWHGLASQANRACRVREAPFGMACAATLLIGYSHRTKRVLRCSFDEAQSSVRLLEPVADF